MFLLNLFCHTHTRHAGIKEKNLCDGKCLRAFFSISLSLNKANFFFLLMWGTFNAFPPSVAVRLKRCLFVCCLLTAILLLFLDFTKKKLLGNWNVHGKFKFFGFKNLLRIFIALCKKLCLNKMHPHGILLTTNETRNTAQ